MTSTNDGKEVKINQASGQKGKSYYIELYKSLDAKLNSEGSLSERVTHLCSAWGRVHTLCVHSASSTHPHLLAWIQRHTATTVLQSEWQSPDNKNEQTRLEEALDAFCEECRDAATRRPSPDWETDFLARAVWYRGLVANPWGHPVLKAVLDTSGEKPTTDDILEWLKEERSIAFAARLRQLALSKCEDLALDLLTAVMDRVRACRDPPADLALVSEPADAPPTVGKRGFEAELDTEAGFGDIWDLLTDMELVLLDKRDKSNRVIDLVKLMPLVSGQSVVDRLLSRLDSAPRDKRLWKNAKQVATLLTQVMITRCMVVPVCGGALRSCLQRYSAALCRCVPPGRLPRAAAPLAAPAASAAHLHTLAYTVHKWCEKHTCEELRPFVVELYVRAITSGMNELEKLKLKPEYTENAARATEQTLSWWFVQLGALLAGSARMQGECTLTAFSVHPSGINYKRIQDLPVHAPVPAPAVPAPAPATHTHTDTQPTQESQPSEFGSWANDSRSQTNFVKTSEHLNIKQTQHQANVLSTAILSEGDALGLDAELCQDIAVLLSGPRVKTLSWDMDRKLLLDNCLAYMERTGGGTRALTTELKYLNLDPREYQHLPEEDTDDDDLYYGIEKGYEHLVEFEAHPEEIWQDAERTETAHSSCDESWTSHRRKKNSKKKLAYSSESDESDPLSTVAEKKEKKKERPHSKERSKERKKKEGKKEKQGKDAKKEEKEPKPKKERKKREKKPKSALVGLKLTKVGGGVTVGTDSDYESQGKSSQQSDTVDDNVIYDGQFSMDELKSPTPEKQLPNKPKATNTTQNPPKRTKNKETKKNVTKLLQLRKKLSETLGVPTFPSMHQSIQTPAQSALVGTKLQDIKALSPKGTCSRAQPYDPTQYRKGPRNVPPPDAPQSETALNLSQKPATSKPATSKSATSNNIWSPPPRQPTPQPLNSTSTHLSSYEKFLQELRRNPNAALSVVPKPESKKEIGPDVPKPESKKEIRPVSRVVPVEPNLFRSQTVANVYKAEPVTSLPPGVRVNQTTNSLLKTEARSTPNISSTCLSQSAHVAQTEHRPNVNMQSDNRIIQTTHNAVQTDAAPSANPAPSVSIHNRVPQTVHNVVKNEPTISSPCAKPVPPKKVENTLNTFARRSYMLNKNKQNDKPKSISETELQVVSDEIDRRIAELRLQNWQTNQHDFSAASPVAKPNESPRVEIQKIEEPPAAPLNAHHPLLTSILKNASNTPPNTPRVRSDNTHAFSPSISINSALTGKDQQDLLRLLEQQNKLNKPPPQTAGRNVQYSNATVVRNVETNKCPAQSTTPQRTRVNSVPQPPPSSHPMQEQAFIWDAKGNKIPLRMASYIKNTLISASSANKIHLPEISNSTIMKTTAMVQTKAQVRKPVQATPKQVNAAQVQKTNLDANKPAVTKKYVPKPPVPTPKFKEDSEQQDWSQVFADLRAHKTPSRGPNALDMAFNKDSFEKVNLGNQLMYSSSMVSNVNTARPEQIASLANVDTQPPASPRPSTTTAPACKQTNASILRNIKQPKKTNAAPVKVVHSDAIKQTSLLRQVRKDSDTFVSGHSTFARQGRKDDDPFISGIQNSDYDMEILEQLIDDDLRQEIGESLSNDDGYPSQNLTATSDNNNANKTPTVIKKMITKKPEVSTWVKPHEVKLPTQNTATSTSQAKPKLQILSNEIVDVRNLSQSLLRPKLILQQPTTLPSNIQEGTIYNKNVNNTPASTNVSTTTTMFYNTIQQPPVQNMVIVDPCGLRAQNYNNDVNNIPNIIFDSSYAAPITIPIIGNTLLNTSQGVSIVYNNSSQMISTNAPTIHIAENVSAQMQPLPNDIQSPSVPYVMPIQSGSNKTVLKSENTIQSQSRSSQPLHSKPIESPKSCISDGKNLPNDCNERISIEPKFRHIPEIIENNTNNKSPVSELNKIRTNRSNLCQPKISSEVKEKLKDKVQEKSASIKVNSQKMATESTESNEIKLEKFRNDQRLAKKRLALLNRVKTNKNVEVPLIELPYTSLREDRSLEAPVSTKPPIPLSYKPLIADQITAKAEKKSFALPEFVAASVPDKPLLKVPENNNDNKTKVVCHRTLLKSSNKLESDVVVPESEKNIDPKCKTRLKENTIESTIKSGDIKSVSLEQLTQVDNFTNVPAVKVVPPLRISKRISNTKSKKNKEKDSKGLTNIETTDEQKPIKTNNKHTEKCILRREENKDVIIKAMTSDSSVDPKDVSKLSDIQDNKSTSVSKDLEEKEITPTANADTEKNNLNTVMKSLQLDQNNENFTVKDVAIPRERNTDVENTVKTTNVVVSISSNNNKCNIEHAVVEKANLPASKEKDNNKITKLLDDIESAICAITESTVSSPVLITPTDNELQDEVKELDRKINAKETIVQTSNPLAKVSQNKNHESSISDQKGVTELTSCKTNNEVSCKKDNLKERVKAKSNTTSIQTTSVKQGRKNSKSALKSKKPTCPINVCDKRTNTCDKDKADSNTSTNKLNSSKANIKSDTTVSKITPEVIVLNSSKANVKSDTTVSKITPEVIVIDDKLTNENTKGEKSMKNGNNAQTRQINTNEIVHNALVHKEDTGVDGISYFVPNEAPFLKSVIEAKDNKIITLSSESDSDAKQISNGKCNEKPPIEKSIHPKHNILQSYKDSIKIEEILDPNNKNPHVKVVRIKLPDNRIFKATIKGKVINYDALFQDPNLRNFLVKCLDQKKRCTLNVSQLSTSDNKLVNTHIQGVDVPKQTPRTVETVDLVSDDDDEQTISTEFGLFKINLDAHVLAQHKVKLAEKCSVKLYRCDETLKGEDLVQALLKDLNVLSPDKTNEVIEIDDSSDDEYSQGDAGINTFKNLLLQDLGVINKVANNSVDVEVAQSNSITQRPSRTRKSKYHRERSRTPNTVESEKCAVPKSKKTKVTNTRTDTSDKKLTKQDISPILRELSIQLTNCDEMVSKLANMSANKLDDNEIQEKDNATCSSLSRRNSFSLLNELDFVDDSPIIVNGFTSPVINVVESIFALNDTNMVDRNSPVMEVYDLIAEMQNNRKFKESTVLKIACDSDWLETKRHMQIMNGQTTSSDEIFIDNEIRDDVTDCGTDVTDLSNADNEDIFTDTFIVPSLSALVTKYFEDNDIIYQLKHLQKTNDVKKSAIKRISTQSVLSSRRKITKTSILHKHISSESENLYVMKSSFKKPLSIIKVSGTQDSKMLNDANELHSSSIAIISTDEDLSNPHSEVTVPKTQAEATQVSDISLTRTEETTDSNIVDNVENFTSIMSTEGKNIQKVENYFYNIRLEDEPIEISETVKNSSPSNTKIDICDSVILPSKLTPESQDNDTLGETSEIISTAVALCKSPSTTDEIEKNASISILPLEHMQTHETPDSTLDENLVDSYTDLDKTAFEMESTDINTVDNTTSILPIERISTGIQDILNVTVLEEKTIDSYEDLSDTRTIMKTSDMLDDQLSKCEDSRVIKLEDSYNETMETVSSNNIKITNSLHLTSELNDVKENSESVAITAAELTETSEFHEGASNTVSPNSEATTIEISGTDISCNTGSSSGSDTILVLSNNVFSDAIDNITENTDALCDTIQENVSIPTITKKFDKPESDSLNKQETYEIDSKYPVEEAEDDAEKENNILETFLTHPLPDTDKDHLKSKNIEEEAETYLKAESDIVITTIAKESPKQTRLQSDTWASTDSVNVESLHLIEGSTISVQQSEGEIIATGNVTFEKELLVTEPSYHELDASNDLKNCKEDKNTDPEFISTPEKLLSDVSETVLSMKVTHDLDNIEDENIILENNFSSDTVASVNPVVECSDILEPSVSQTTFSVPNTTSECSTIEKDVNLVSDTIIQTPTNIPVLISETVVVITEPSHHEVDASNELQNCKKDKNTAPELISPPEKLLSDVPETALTMEVSDSLDNSEDENVILENNFSSDTVASVTPDVEYSDILEPSVSQTTFSVPNTTSECSTIENDLNLVSDTIIQTPKNIPVQSNSKISSKTTDERMEILYKTIRDCYVRLERCAAFTEYYSIAACKKSEASFSTTNELPASDDTEVRTNNSEVTFKTEIDTFANIIETQPKTQTHVPNMKEKEMDYVKETIESGNAYITNRIKTFNNNNKLSPVLQAIDESKELNSETVTDAEYVSESKPLLNSREITTCSIKPTDKETSETKEFVIVDVTEFPINVEINQTVENVSEYGKDIKLSDIDTEVFSDTVCDEIENVPDLEKKCVNIDSENEMIHGIADDTVNEVEIISETKPTPESLYEHIDDSEIQIGNQILEKVEISKREYDEDIILAQEIDVKEIIDDTQDTLLSIKADKCVRNETLISKEPSDDNVDQITYKKVDTSEGESLTPVCDKIENVPVLEKSCVNIDSEDENFTKENNVINGIADDTVNEVEIISEIKPTPDSLYEHIDDSKIQIDNQILEKIEISRIEYDDDIIVAQETDVKEIIDDTQDTLLPLKADKCVMNEILISKGPSDDNKDQITYKKVDTSEDESLTPSLNNENEIMPVPEKNDSFFERDFVSIKNVNCVRTSESDIDVAEFHYDQSQCVKEAEVINNLSETDEDTIKGTGIITEIPDSREFEVVAIIDTEDCVIESKLSPKCEDAPTAESSYSTIGCSPKETNLGPTDRKDAESFIHETKIIVEDFSFIVPKYTYSKHNLKRKSKIDDGPSSIKKLRRSSRSRHQVDYPKLIPVKLRSKKNIDYPKICMSSANADITKDFERRLDYYSTVEFAFDIIYTTEFIDAPDLLQNWPISGPLPNHDPGRSEDDSCLFADLGNDGDSSRDPMNRTFAEEITDNTDHPNWDIEETNFNMGFGERSGRVIQNLDGGAISKFSAATLSDVKQTQPSLLSEKYNKSASNLLESTNLEELDTIKRFLSYIRTREKIKSFFKKSIVELECQNDENYNKKDGINHYSNDLFPFELLQPKYIEPCPPETTVQVVQVGQLPVSAAVQNPVTCDPRVTQVSDASPSQCSVENSPQDDSQQSIKTEYTELTTADLSLPLVDDYVQHNQTVPDDTQYCNMLANNENIPIETELVKSEVKIELEEEEDKDKDSNEPSEDSDHIDNADYMYESNNTNEPIHSEIPALVNTDKQDNYEPETQPKPQNGAPEKTDQIAYAMNAAGITTTSESINTRTQALVNLLSQKLRQGAVVTAQTSANNYPKTTSINAMSLQQALAQILPPPLNQTSSADNNQQGQNTLTPQVLHIVHGKNSCGNQITVVDNSQQSVINTPNATPVLHIVQNKTATTGPNADGGPTPTNTFSGISLVDAGLQQGGNQLLHIVNTGNQKNNNAGQLLKRVNLLTNIANVQGSNEQKMVQFVCKSADGKSIQLNAPHQRSMVLRLQPIETPTVQTAPPKLETNQNPDQNSTQNAGNSPPDKDSTSTQQEIKSRSVYEENYAKFIQNSSNKPTLIEKAQANSLPKFNQAFGKAVFQDGEQKQNEINSNSLPAVNDSSDNTECQPTDNTINLEHIAPINSPPLLLRKPPTSSNTTQPNLVQQIKQTIAPVNIQTMHGGVIYTRQIPVNIGGGQTINLITVPSTELVDENGQKQQNNQGETIEPSIIKIVPQSQPPPNGEASQDDMNSSSENSQQNLPQPHPVLTQMRIKLPMLSKAPQMVSGARVVRPSFFQIQRNVIGGANQVYQQLVLTAAPPLGQQTIRLPSAQTRQVKAPDNQSSSESQMSTSTLEQLREFDMVLEQVKERSTVQPTSSNVNNSFKLLTPSTDTTDGPSSASSTSGETTQVFYSIGSHQPLNVTYVNRKPSISTPTTTTFVRSPDSSGIADSPTSSTHSQIPHTSTSEASSSETPSTQHKPSKSSSRSKSRPKSSHTHSLKLNSVPPKASTQKPLEDEQTTQRILYILAEYKEQVENSPDKDKPAPRRRTNPPSNPGSSKRKKSSSGSRRSGRDLSPMDDSCRTMGSEDSSCGTSQGDCTESCLDSHSPQDSPRKVARKLTFEQESPSPSTPQPQPKPQPQRNVIVADGQTITVARGTAGKPTAVLMPANYILPVSMVKGGQQIAIVTNRGPKLLAVGGGEGGATNALLLQRLIGSAGLKPVLARPGVRHVRLPTAALHNIQAFNLAPTNVQPPDSTASPAPEQTTPDLVETKRSNHSSWTEQDSEAKPDRASSPEEAEPWNLPPHEYSYEETVRSENMDRTVLDPIPDRYSPDMEAQRIFDKMFDVDAKKSYIVDSPRCAYDIETSDGDDKPYQVVHKKDSGARQTRLAHVSAAALRHKYAILEHELRLQKSLSEECSDLGVDSPSASELFPEAELLFAASPAHEHAHEHAPDTPQHEHAAPPPIANQTVIQPDLDDQIATDQLLPRQRPELDSLGLEDVGIVTVSEDGLQATIALDHEEFARAHPNTTFHSEPTDAEEVQPFTITGLKSRHITSTIFHSNRAPATVLMTAPQATVISQANPEPNIVKYADIDNMIHTIPSSHNNALPSVLVKDDGLTRFENILTDSRELHLSNTASAIVHSANATQVIRRVCYDESKRERENFLMDENDAIIAGDDAKMVAEDSSRDATLESVGGDDDNSSPERHAELFWESNSASERSESRRPLDFSSDSEKCCKSPSFDETNSTDSSGVGAHMRLDSVIKDARGIERSGSADGSSADDTHPPLRTYPPKRLYHTTEGEMERSLSGKTRAGERSPDLEVRRRASGRGVVKRGCHCCNGSPAPPRPKKPRQRKPTMDFTQ